MLHQRTFMLVIGFILLAISACKRPISGSPTVGTDDRRPAGSELSGTKESVEEPLDATVLSIDAGDEHTCAVTQRGQLLCWGAFASDGLTDPGVNRPTPIGADLDWTTVEVGDGLTCGLKKDASLWCFASDDGGFGSAGSALSGTPMRVGTANDWQSISSNGGSACGIRSGGQAYCVNKGEIVNAEKFQRVPGDELLEAVDGPTDVRAVSRGLTAGCAVTQTGELWCWGRLGQSNEQKPVRVGSRTDWQYVEMNLNGGCATRTDGKVYCWFPDESRRPVGPQDAKPMNIVATTPESLTVGMGYACADTADGWKCWGAFAAGQRGPGVTSTAPASLPDAAEWDVVKAGRHHTCALKEGRPYCWGDNGFGQLGNGRDGGPRSRPTPLNAAVTFRSISSEAFHACGITTDEDLYCWGENGLGQFDEVARGSAASPRHQFTESKWRDVEVTGARNYAVRADGTLWAFGFEERRQMTDETDWKDVEDYGRTCATKTDGSLWCWLDKWDAPPTKLSDGVRSFGVGYRSVCAHRKDGTSECFQLIPASRAGDRYVLAPTRWKTFEAAADACGITESGVLGCFEPFDGKRPSSMYAPPRFEPLLPDQPDAKWVDLSLGAAHSCAIQADRSLWCWGFDRAGALGLGPELEKSKVPSKVGERSWSYVSVGDESTCGITTEGKAFCWGRHYIVGDGNWLSPSPQVVVAVADGASSQAAGELVE